MHLQAKGELLQPLGCNGGSWFRPFDHPPGLGLMQCFGPNQWAASAVHYIQLCKRMFIFPLQAEGVSEASSEPERTNASAEQYAAACKEAGKAAGTPVLDMFSKFPDGSHDWMERFFSDGLHFTPAGQQRVYLLLVECMAEHFPELRSAFCAFAVAWCWCCIGKVVGEMRERERERIELRPCNQLG